MIKKLLIYISDSFNPYINLAREKYLLDNTPDDALILYLWQNENTVVIGRNQNALSECRCAVLSQDGGNLARRLSGGGAVFHDLGNLNFTFLCSSENYNLTRNMNVLSLACKRAGIETQLSGRNDILADGRKFSGNAFYNSKGKSYHHGTIMIDADTEKMQRYLSPPKAKLEAKGVKSVRSRVVNLKELNSELNCEKMKEHMIKAFEESFGLKAFVIESIEDDEITKLAKKYSSWDYLYGTQPPFTFSCEERFEWGSVDIKLNVIKGIIKEASVFTDSMDWLLSEKLQTALNGCRFEIGEIKNSLIKQIDTKTARDITDIIEKNL